MEAIRVQFKPLGKRYFFGVGKLKLTNGTKVVVSTIRGTELGYCVGDVFDLNEMDLTSELKDVLRIATQNDIEQFEYNKTLEADILKKTKELSKTHNLEMKVLESEYTLDRSKLIIYFESEGRVDFRDLVKDLADIYHTRIELRQVGARDKAKEIGGIGVCGRKLCCNGMLTSMDTVTINMAKNQNLALNPSKINGQCNRLLCCLSFEDDSYTEARKDMPKMGSKMDTEIGKGEIIGLDLLNRKCTVQVENERIVVDLSDKSKK